LRSIGRRLISEGSPVDTLIDEMTVFDARAYAVPFTVHLNWKLKSKAELHESHVIERSGGSPMAYAPE
jgi:hypothetical protein